MQKLGGSKSGIEISLFLREPLLTYVFLLKIRGVGKGELKSSTFSTNSFSEIPNPK